MSEVIASEIGNEARVATLSGPNHAEEICRGGLSAAVIASEDPQVGETFKDLLLSTAFRIYLSQDMTGVEVCGAMKNVIAIVCGISAGSGAGDNTLALIMTRGLAEISRLVHARGGQAMTCMGLAGMGDLIATCTSEHSRNRTFAHAYGWRGRRRGPQRERACPFTGRRHSAHLCRGANALQRCYFG